VQLGDVEFAGKSIEHRTGGNPVGDGTTEDLGADLFTGAVDGELFVSRGIAVLLAT
jgi:hypothetical protein